MIAIRFPFVRKTLLPPVGQVVVIQNSTLTKYTKIIQVKKQKTESADPVSSSSLSPEQLERIARNKQAALERLAAHSAPDGVGESWQRALSKEFSKSYFKEVSSSSVFTWGVSAL